MSVQFTKKKNWNKLLNNDKEKETKSGREKQKVIS